MSDDDMPAGCANMGDMGGDISDDDTGEGAAVGGGDKLPEGVDKEILTEAPFENWKKPKKGDESACTMLAHCSPMAVNSTRPGAAASLLRSHWV